jgi:cytochrome c-type biogenesis protein CcmH
MKWARFALAATIAALVLGAALLLTERPASIEDTTHQISAALRCPTCQGISVADSPSPVARDMRDRIASELRAGRSPAEIEREFVAVYGDWILLDPQPEGIGLLPWAVPIVLSAGGALGWLLVVRRWTRPHYERSRE